MVARGDLGVEIHLENVPVIQKMLVDKANAIGKPVIIATQMLRSMVRAPQPTRAEATDVAHAVLDGADAVMLSEETATGDYPVDAVRFMVRITESAEKIFPHEKYLKLLPKKKIPDSVAHVSCVLADHLNAAAIVPTTRSGFTATQISRFRPKPKIIALSPDKTTVKRLSLYWGCSPTLIDDTNDTDEMIEKALEAGAEDVQSSDDIYEIYTEFAELENVRSALESAGIEMISAEPTMIPQNTIKLEGKQAEQMLKLYEGLEDLDDVAHIYANFDIDESIMEEMTEN